MALTKLGYKRETYEEILARTETKAKELFGQDANTSSRSALGFILRIIAWSISLVWQDNENVYYSAYRNTAEGKQLDNLLPYAGITRNPASSAYGDVTFTGEANTLIPLGTIVSKADDTLYYTAEEKRISSNGTITIEVVAQELGSVGNADIGEINALLTSISGIESVSNPQAITNGQERESDVEVRKRADEVVEGQGSGTVDAIRAELLKNSDIRAVYVDANEDDVTNEYGTPSRAVQCFVLGGDENDIAEAIFKKKAGGIQAYGTTFVQVQDDGGTTHKIGFTYAEIVQIYAKVTLTTNNTFEVDGHKQVRRAIAEYIGGLDEDHIVYTGLSMGENVVLSKIIAAITDVTGVEDVEVLLSSDGENYEAHNIVMSRPQIPQISANSIEVV